MFASGGTLTWDPTAGPRGAEGWAEGASRGAAPAPGPLLEDPSRSVSTSGTHRCKVLSDLETGLLPVVATCSTDWSSYWKYRPYTEVHALPG